MASAEDMAVQVLQAIQTRRSVRDYEPTPVARALIEQLLQAATLAPSSMNAQPWAFSVTQHPETLRRYSADAKRCFLETLPKGSSPPHLAELLDPQFDIFYNAPTLLVVWAKPGSAFPEQDCCLAASHILLAAQALGLSSCPIGFAKPYLNRDDIKRELGAPLSCVAVFPLVLGYGRGAASGPPRRPPELFSWQE